MDIGRRLGALGAGALLTLGAAVLPEVAPAAAARPAAAPPATDIPMIRFGGDARTVRATAAGARHIVLVDTTAALDAVLADLAVRPSSVWRNGVIGFAADLDATTVARLRTAPGIRSVQANGRVQATATQDDAPWGLDRIDQAALPLNGRYGYTNTGSGVTAYVIDSGAWMTHVEFGDRIPYAFYWGEFPDAWDCDGHGTHVTGTLGGTTWGVAKQVTIVPVRMLDCEGAGTDEAMLGAIDAVIQDHLPGQPAVVNMSVGGPASAAIDAAVDALVADGLTVVAAAGNEGADACGSSPGRAAAAITVAASDIDDVDADFSNYGPCLDLYAPGVEIRSAYIDTAPGGTANDVSAFLDGTSMASPHVAGVAALVLESQPEATPAEVWDVIDGAATVGVLTEYPGNPDKLLRVPALAPPPRPDLATLQPVRLHDSRAGAGPTLGGGVTEIQVAGAGGVPADAALAALNVTAVDPSGPGYLTVYPCGTTLPNASNVNFGTFQTIPNAAVVRIGAGGKVCVFASVTTGLLVDVNGYAPAGSALGPLDPFRLYDSRFEPVPRTPGQITEVQVAGRGGVSPAATAALLNVTAVDALDVGYFTVYPCGTAPPQASNLNFRQGQTIANAVLARIGTNGRVCIYSSAPAGVIVDVNAAAAPGATVVGLDPFRLLDTRDWDAAPGAGEEVQVYVTGFGGVPAAARTVLLNVTAVDTTAPGYMTVYPCGAARPEASNLNFGTGETIPNAVVAKVGVEGSVCIYTSATADVIVDVNGYAA